MVTSRRPLSPVLRQLLAIIKEQDSVTHKQLRDRFRGLANAAGKGSASWLYSRLERLEADGYIECTEELRNRAWSIVPGAWERALAGGAIEQFKLRDTAPELAHIAQPRRVSMFGESYKPAPVAMRPGAMDYAAVPSLHMGQRRAFRGETQLRRDEPLPTNEWKYGNAKEAA
jgi:hypothetical protein